MKRKRFREEQIIEILRLHRAGAKPADLCRQHGISETTLYGIVTLCTRAAKTPPDAFIAAAKSRRGR